MSHLETFKQLVDQFLQVQINEDLHEFQLIECLEFNPDPSQEISSYKLLFLSPFKEEYFEQGVFRVQLSTEDLPIFMVPIGQDSKSGQILYEAIFN